MSPRLPDSVEHWPLDRLRAYARNPRTHSDEQVAQIAASIVEFGWTSPVLVSGDGTVIAGHGRLEAARRLGLDAVPVVVLDHLSEAQRRAYAIADNKLALNAGWNEELLAAELHALNGDGFDLALTGFDEAELDRLMAPLDDTEAMSPGGDTGENGDAADEAPEPPRNPVSRPGDLWRLGDHRLLCGDSTDAESVARIMDGERASLLFTSPPYGNQRNYTTGGIGDWDALMRGVFCHLDEAMAEDGQVLVNLGLVHRDNEWQPYWEAWLAWMRAQGWRRFGLYVWDQGAGLPGDWNGRLAPSFELLFHLNRLARKPNKIVPCKWAGHINDSHGGMRGKDGTVGEWTHAGQGVQETRIPDNVLRITRHKARGIETEHPAVFPVALPEFVMSTYSAEGDVVFEPFAGSGTTIIAGERTGRCVRAIELAPEYVDVALLRWRQLFPGTEAVLDGDGRTFEAVAAERGVDPGSMSGTGITDAA
ncbi:site-specific DNA-methyltransferase [Elioraea sp.]|uniref:site-specific DNA-methyltransferase n=1 Tax=Elioraea sp. TaxID=2185103 RepID=UPI0021DC4DEF|nr:site-specific DNA-methyltransferase [Elioraea sp.]GIX11777.1 MAG: methyltransferase [Elioraea sp.]